MSEEDRRTLQLSLAQSEQANHDQSCDYTPHLGSYTLELIPSSPGGVYI